MSDCKLNYQFLCFFTDGQVGVTFCSSTNEIMFWKLRSVCYFIGAATLLFFLEDEVHSPSSFVFLFG